MSYKLNLNIVIISLMINACLTVTYLEPQVSGKSTYYGGNPSGGACGYASVATATFPFGYYAACGGAVFDSGYGCGKCYEITCIGPYSPNPSCYCSSTTPSVIISCMDQCPECADTHFDLDPTAMARIVGPGLSGTCGVIETTVRRVSCEYTTNIHIRAKSGTSEFWYGLHIDNIAGWGSVSAVQLKSNGASTYDTTCDKASGPSYWGCNGGFPLSVPMTVKLTNDNGDIIVFDNCITNFNGGADFNCGGNFAGGGTPTPTTATLSPTTRAPTTSSCGVRNIKFVSVTESQSYWLAFYVEDVCTSCGTITNVEVLDSSAFGSYVSGDNSDPRGFWAYDDVATNHGGYEWTAPVTVKITISNSEVLTFTDVLTSVNGDLTFNTNDNFCQSSTATPTSVTPGPVSQPSQSPIVLVPTCIKDVKFTMQEGSQLWWLAFYVDELCCGNVAKVEVKDYANYPAYVTGVVSEWDYFVFSNADYGGQSFTAPLSVRVTNNNNEVIEFVDVLESVDPDYIYYGNPNFCQPSPTSNPVASPTSNPIPTPTSNPTVSPSNNPVTSPTSNPISSPTGNPVTTPTDNPVTSPTNNPIPSPTSNPIASSTNNPIAAPTNNPTKSPTVQPTSSPTSNPSPSPTNNPLIPGSPTHTSKSPTQLPTNNPTVTPTNNPTISPTNNPTLSPTSNPTQSPTDNPTLYPTENPLAPGSPTKAPSDPTPFPSKSPIKSPTDNPTESPTNNPVSSVTTTVNPTRTPSKIPTQLPSESPSKIPTELPSESPTKIPSKIATDNPSVSPTSECDETCDLWDDDNDEKRIIIKVIFWFPPWIIYDLAHIRCWLHEIFMKWFINFEFVKYFDVCDIKVIVIGGTTNVDNNCQNGPCLWNKNNIRRVLLQSNTNEGNISVSIICNDDDTFNAINALSMNSMSNQLHEELMNRFDLDINAKVEVVKETEGDGQVNVEKNDLNMMQLMIIVGIVCLIFICLMILFGMFCCKRCKKRKQYTKSKEGITSGEMMGGGTPIHKMHQTNVMPVEDYDDDLYDNTYALNKYPASYETKNIYEL